MESFRKWLNLMEYYPSMNTTMLGYVPKHLAYRGTSLPIALVKGVKGEIGRGFRQAWDKSWMKYASAPTHMTIMWDKSKWHKQGQEHRIKNVFSIPLPEGKSDKEIVEFAINNLKTTLKEDKELNSSLKRNNIDPSNYKIEEYHMDKEKKLISFLVSWEVNSSGELMKRMNAQPQTQTQQNIPNFKPDIHNQFTINTD